MHGVYLKDRGGRFYGRCAAGRSLAGLGSGYRVTGLQAQRDFWLKAEAAIPHCPNQ
ncbi:hypothetical protein EMIT0196P_60350 [Pseudomonas chlororaphis]